MSAPTWPSPPPQKTSNPLSRLSAASATIHKLSGACGLLNGDHLGTPEETIAFQDEALAAHQAINAAMLLVVNHRELAAELIFLIDSETRRANRTNVAGREV